MTKSTQTEDRRSVSPTSLGTLLITFLLVGAASFAAPPDDPPAPIEVAGCDEWDDDTFQLNNVAEMSKLVPQTEEGLESARAQFTANLYVLALAEVEMNGIDPPDCPTELCAAEGGLSCAAGFRIDRVGDKTEVVEALSVTIFFVEYKFYRITWTFAAQVSVDTGCSPCLVDPNNIG